MGWLKPRIEAGAAPAGPARGVVSRPLEIEGQGLGEFRETEDVAGQRIELAAAEDVLLVAGGPGQKPEIVVAVEVLLVVEELVVSPNWQWCCCTTSSALTL